METESTHNIKGCWRTKSDPVGLRTKAEPDGAEDPERSWRPGSPWCRRATSDQGGARRDEGAVVDVGAMVPGGAEEWRSQGEADWSSSQGGVMGSVTGGEARG